MAGLRAAALALLACLPATPAAAAEGGGEGPAPAPPRKDSLPSDPALPLGERVNRAIDGGVRWLRGRASPAGTFGEILGDVNYAGGSQSYDYPAGPTALALYTLLKCGVPADDPVVAKGFAWLRKHQEVPCSCYEISALMLALEARANPWKRETDRERDARSRARKGGKLDLSVKLPPADAAWLRKLAEALVPRQQKEAGWRYALSHPRAPGTFASDAPLGATSDTSSTQFALLALLAGERCGIRQPDAVYRTSLDWILKTQEEAGPEVARFDPMPRPAGGEEVSAVAPVVDRARGWSYVRGSRKAAEAATTGSMTACGLASLAIAGALLEDRGGKSWPKELAARTDRAWWDGIAWLQEHWTVTANPNSPWYAVYHLYCVERAADLRGIRLVGGHDWYTEGAGVLVDRQKPDGSWWDAGHRPEDLLSTCFALLFLNRSTPALTGR